MKQIFVEELKQNQNIMDFFMVKMIGIKTGGNGKVYLDLKLGDKTGEVNSKKWDIADDEKEMLDQIKEGEIVKVKASVTDWQNQKQLRVTKIRKAVESDGLKLEDFIKAAPERPGYMYEYLLDIAKSMEDRELGRISQRILEENKEALMYYPAAMRNHHAEFAGLLWHMKRMVMTGLKLCDVYTDLDRDLLVTGVIVHDIEKIHEIHSDHNGVSPGYSFEGQMLGHIVMGIKYLEKVGDEMGVSREKLIMLEHMILSHHYEPEFGSPKKPLFPEAEMLHYLDIIDARMFDMSEALATAEAGDFSDRVWTLDNRRLYKPESMKKRMKFSPAAGNAGGDIAGNDTVGDDAAGGDAPSKMPELNDGN